MPGRLLSAICACAILAAIAPGCGGGSSTVAFKKGGAAAPPKCLKRWNDDPEALADGKHAYSPGHDSRAGHLFGIDKPEEGLKDACVAVFAADESDREFGILGWYSVAPGKTAEGLVEGGGWDVITYYPVSSQEERIALQKKGADEANVSLGEDGKLAPLE
jgi:hypothetical protein